MKLIPLRDRHGKARDFAKVDDEDFDSINAHRWCLSQRGYALTRTGKRPRQRDVWMHRVVLGLADGDGIVDHADGDKLNNTRANLRHCSAAENGWNRGPQYNNTSGHKGVYRQKTGRWFARITVNRRPFYLGTFATREEAAAAYLGAARVLHGRFLRASPVKRKAG
jgi:hypothetical protein